MRLADRPRAETDGHGTENLDHLDRKADPDDLAGRLAQLPAGHPSADPAADGPGEDDRDPDDPETGDVAPHDVNTDDLDYDDLDPDDTRPDDTDDGATAGRLRPRRTGDAPTWGEPDVPARSPYRPWFGADGASDPWFAPDLTE